jgi:hypothetical protein
MIWSMLSVTLSARGKAHLSSAQLGREVVLDRAYDCPAHPAHMFALPHGARRAPGPRALSGGRL